VGVFRKWFRFVEKKHTKLQIVFVALFVAGAVVLYYWQGRVTQNALASQMLHREQVIARSGINSIARFLNGVGRSLSLVATDEKVKSGDVGYITQRLEHFMKVWEVYPVNALSFIDKDGIVQANVNNEGITGIGVNVSDREYFTWASGAVEGEYHIAPVILSRFGVTKGKYIVPVASPVFNENGEYIGLIAAVVYLDEMVKNFSDPLKISDSTLVHLLNSRGEFVFSSSPLVVGKHISQMFDGFDFPLKEKLLRQFLKEFDSPALEGKLDVIRPDMNNGGKLTRYLIAYSTATVDFDRNWTLIIATPASDAYLFTGPFYRDQIVNLIYVIVGSIVFAILGITLAKVRPR
jgi:hypothetical protein